MRRRSCTLALLLAAAGAPAAPSAELTLGDYQDAEGAISVVRQGDSVDPYFALQALQLAQDHGLEAQPAAQRWAQWLLPRQKPDATFDRFCRRGPVWGPCQTADADDSLLALWLMLLDTLPPSPQRQDSRRAASVALQKLHDPARGIYLVSPVYQHGLFMDNLEVWDYLRRTGDSASAAALARAIQRVFWDGASRRFLVSTQPEQRHEKPRFYPDAVAQVFPLLVRFPLLPGPASAYYRSWMRQHRAEWLAQVKTDFAWGLVAVLAWRQGDLPTARCWLRTTAAFRHTHHWTVTDEVAHQILSQNGVTPAAPQASCN